MGAEALVTPRLSLRRWRDSDRPSFRTMNADPTVMATIGPIMNDAQADGLLDRIEQNFEQWGFGLWCVDLDGLAIGWCGLSVPAFLPGEIEIGWRLSTPFWGQGYATEAARAVVDDAFGRLRVSRLISFTAESNHRSQAVMERLGMTREPADDFDHPALAVDDPLRRHVLYRLTPEHLKTSR